MIDFDYTATQKNLREMIHWFAEYEIRPISLQSDREHAVPETFLRKVVDMGIGGGVIPKPMGGEGEGAGEETDARGSKQGNRFAIIGAEETSWGDAGVIMNFPGPGLGGPPIRFMGTKEQKERFFGIFKPGTIKYGAYGLTEPGAGSDVAGIRTTCRKDGTAWVLNGTKCFITNGGKADWVVIFATVDAAQGRAGHRAFVVEKGTPGFRLGKIEDKMGLRASETAELVLEDCRVPEENLLGGEDLYRSKEGFMGAMKTFNSSRPMVAAMAVGIARAALERARDFVKENYVLARPLARYRQIADLLATDFRLLEAARLMTWRAAWMADDGIPNAAEASMSKAYAAQVGQKCVTDAMQICGAAGLASDAFLEKWFRDMKVFDIFEGTGQIQRIVISKRILRDPPASF